MTKITNRVMASPHREGFKTWRTLIPGVAPLMGGGAKLHNWALNLAQGNAPAAYLLESSIGAGLIAAAIAGTTRLAQHVNRVSELSEADNPEKGIARQTGTTFNVALDDKDKNKKNIKTAKVDTTTITSDEVAMPGITDVTANVAYTGIPMAVALLSAAGAWKGIDYLADKRRNAMLDRAIAGKRNTIKQLIKARAQLARGTIDDAGIQQALNSINDRDNYVKTAEEKPAESSVVARPEDGLYNAGRKVLTSYGMLAAGLLGLSAVGSYAYFSAADKNNIRYKAMKRGINDYAKVKAMNSPVTIVPKNSDQYFEDIDKGAQDKDKPRDRAEMAQPSIPISVTL